MLQKKKFPTFIVLQRRFDLVSHFKDRITPTYNGGIYILDDPLSVPFT